METDRDNLRDVVSYFLQKICQMEEELAAHERLLLWSRRVPGTPDAMDLLLEHARKSIVLPQHLQKTFDEYLDHMADRLVDALGTQSGAQQLEGLSDMVARRNRFIN